MYMQSIFNNSVFDNFDNWMDFSFPSFNQRLYGASSSQLMKTDVKETDKDYEVSIDLPGFKKDELQIELKDGYLTVSGSKEVTSKDMPEENQKDATTAEADGSHLTSDIISDVQDDADDRRNRGCETDFRQAGVQLDTHEIR